MEPNRAKIQPFSLVKFLKENNRLDDLWKASEDEEYRNKLIQELFPQNQDPNQ